MSTTTEPKPQLEENNNSKDFNSQPRFSVADLLPKSVRNTFIGPARANWRATGLYMVGAVACVGITAALMWWNRPAPIAEYGKVGEPFFADFVDPTNAMSLEVFTFDKDNVEPRDFRVEQQASGQWVIPSHHNYPADAAEQLADTASSIIGITRGAMVTRWSADHAKYGVVNPKQEALGVDEVDGVGQRLTLKGEKDSVLADFIVGHQVEGSFDQYYVRHPDEDEVYLTTLNVDLSTRFSDWIDTELFDLNSADVRSVTLNDYSFDELNGKITQSEISKLSRKDSGNDWILDSLAEDTEELNKESIRETVNEISNLKIAGVRPKQEGLTPDLTLDKSALKSQSGVDRLQTDLLSRGFILQPTENDGKLKLIAREGEMSAGTKDGLVYHLHFGRVFTGSQEELEIGFVSTKKPSVDKVDSNDQLAQASEEVAATVVDSDSEVENTGESNDDSGKPGRYVFVRVDFDKKLLGEEPKEPVKPTKSERLIELEKIAASDTEDSSVESGAENDRLDGDPDDSSKTETNEDGATELVDQSNSDDENNEESEKSELEQLQEEFSTLTSDYERDLRAFNDFKNKVAEGQEKADELNSRFAKWYYVISGESYDNLALDRSGLVRIKTVDEDKGKVEDRCRCWGF